MRIKMTTGLSGPATSLAIGDTPTMDDVAGQRLIDAGFAVLHTDEPTPEPVTEPASEQAMEPTPAPKQTRRKAD